jgi:hypothetical protein
MVSDGQYDCQNSESIQFGQNLSFKISTQVWEATGMKNHRFYMTPYLIAKFHVAHMFLDFNWVYDLRKAPINEYFSQLWEVNYKNHIYDISDYLVAPFTNSFC